MTELAHDPAIEAVIFDMDGVLVDSEGALADIAALSLRDDGVPASPQDFEPFIGMGEDAYIGGVVRLHGMEYRPFMKAHIYARYIELAPDRVREFPGAADLVRDLVRSGFRVAVGSSADRPKVLANLSALGLEESDLHALVTGSDIHRKKPEPDIYLEAARRIRADPARCLVVEDAESGVRAAVAAGMTCLGVATSRPADALVAAGATSVLPDLSALRTLLSLPVRNHADP